MAATLYGEANFGLSEETGIYVDSLEFDISIEEKLFKNGSGVDTGGTLYNPQVTFSMSGVLKTDAAIETEVGASLTITNALTWADYIPGYSSGGVTYLLGVKPSLKQDDFEMLDLNGRFAPFMAPAA